MVNGAPVWAAEHGERLNMWRVGDGIGDGMILISKEATCAAGNTVGWMKHTVRNPDVQAPTQLLSNKWMSSKKATLGPQFTSAPKYASAAGNRAFWVDVPDMRITAVHGLDDAEPAMAAALRQLAALPNDE